MAAGQSTLCSVSSLTGLDDIRLDDAIAEVREYRAKLRNVLDRKFGVHDNVKIAILALFDSADCDAIRGCDCLCDHHTSIITHRATAREKTFGRVRPKAKIATYAHKVVPTVGTSLCAGRTNCAVRAKQNGRWSVTPAAVLAF